MELWTAFTLGILGSFHCIGMCGPIALSIPGKNNSKAVLFLNGMLYNIGRILSYATLGFVLGVLGMGATIAGYQNVLSVILGTLIIIFSLFKKIPLPAKVNQLYTHFTKNITYLISSLFRDNSRSAPFLIGLLNGFLPCGFVVTALAAALITSTALHSSMYMALFGIGTVPVMLMLNVAPGFVSPQFRSKLRPFSTYFAIIIGILLIYRGLMMMNGSMMHG